MPLDELLKKLDASSSGLSNDEAQKRLLETGPNELEEKKTNLYLKFLSYFWGPIPGLIIIAAVLSGVLKHWPDLGVILTLLVLNAIIGFREEYQANSAIEALKEKLATQARVMRDGQWRSIPARELVPGDVVRLRFGEIIPADARIIGNNVLQVDQSALTGESLPVVKNTSDAVFSGSIVKQGETEALVYGTGEQTFYGKTAQLVESAQTRSHLQKAVLKIADYLMIIAAVLAVVIIGASLLRGDQLVDVLQFALVLAIAAVPVAMPAVMSVTMALGARTLSGLHAIVTRLPAIEELAGVDILCSDKTGTLTQSKITPGEPFTMDGVQAEDLILSGALASRAEDQDPIDMAVLGGVKDQETLKKYRITKYIPFNPVDKRTEASVQGADGKEFKVSKGAPQVMLRLDKASAEFSDKVNAKIDEYASKGFRALGVARADTDDEWHFLGVIPLYDPLREDSRETVDSTKKMGLQLKMVTGDQTPIAKEIARQLGMGSNILNAEIFDETKPHQAGQLADAIEKADGFAQVFPEHKYHIVEVLQQRGHIVGMTGDGVNDAPALKKADAGIAVAGATDAARAAASIVLLVPGLSAIVKAIEESRRIFYRMSNYAVYRIAETVALLIFLSLAIILFNVYPVTAIMIVLLAILNDGAILSIAYDNVRFENHPETWNMKIVLGVASSLGIFATLRSFGIFYLGQNVFGLDSAMLQTMVYLNLSIGGHLTVFVARTRGSLWSVPPSKILLGAVTGTQLLATIIAVYGFLMPALGWQWAGFVWAYCLGMFVIQNFVKLGAYKVFDSEHSMLLVKGKNS